MCAMNKIISMARRQLRGELTQEQLEVAGRYALLAQKRLPDGPVLRVCVALLAHNLSVARFNGQRCWVKRGEVASICGFSDAHDDAMDYLERL